MRGAVWGAVLVVMAAGLGAASAPAIAAVHVHISGFAFSPKTPDVAVGDTVTWDNHDAATHTVTALDGSFNSGNLLTGATFSRTFTSVGTFNYRCNIHTSMTGAIRVVVPGALPDLAVTNIVLPEDVPDTTLGLSQPITVSLQNGGDATAAASTLRVSYRYQGTLHTIGAASIASLGPGESASASFVWDTKLKVGDFPVVAEADSAGAVGEANEANNAAEVVAGILVDGVPGIDLLDPV
ncbi:MAG TPA: CARDB domain-containing protein [Candidatus Thermoplasmatota archaeon]|jgi:plastocyanin|nr:CARDB domain-containing protein [Candidatus Thermoplasmatota archaeon]